VENDYAIKLYSKLRSSIGGLYQWRVSNAKSSAERNRMTAEADFAFRQAFAFCPRSPEAIFRYVNLLVSVNRMDDAVRVAITAQSLEPENQQVDGLVRELRRQKETQTK
jgi:Flp pilus assembly protein TadD